ncbi:MAG: hypothetical protein NTY20_05845 [Candidatus Aenigmarchaeota archaeon]|nr:hypothetical protein [Candidatus Aenigmarchaeota archaeon]
MALTVKLKADSFYDGADILKSELFQAMVDIFPKGFYVKEIGKSLYEIHLPNEPSNWQEILRQWGQII